MQQSICKPGPVFPVITPFNSQGYVDYDILESYVDFLIENGAQTIYVMAHSSRLGLLTTQEIRTLNYFIIKKCNKNNVTVIAGTPIWGGVVDYLDVITSAAVTGANTVSVLFPERYYNDEQVVDFYKYLIKEIGVKILIHEEGLNAKRGCQKIPWPKSLIERVMAIPGVVGLKEDSHDNIQTESILSKYSKSHTVILAGGGKEQFLDFAPLCKNYLVGVGSFIPELALLFYQKYNSGEYAFCKEIVEKIEKPFFKVAMEIGWHLALKSAMEHLGIMSRYERMPLRSLPIKEHINIGIVTEQIMREVAEIKDRINKLQEWL